LRQLIARGLVARFRQDFGAADMVVGIAKAGISWGTLLAWELGLPAGIVHLDGPRKSGLQRQIEGAVVGRKVVLIDNLTRSHSSLISAARLVEAEGGRIAGAMTVVGLETGPAPFRVSTLCSESDLEREGLRQGMLSPAHLHGLVEGTVIVPPTGGTKSNN
jgi:orotate phosphoribosyltransferase